MPGEGDVQYPQGNQGRGVFSLQDAIHDMGNNIRPILQDLQDIRPMRHKTYHDTRPPDMRPP